MALSKPHGQLIRISTGDTLDYCDREAAIVEFKCPGLDDPDNRDIAWIPDDETAEVLVVEDLLNEEEQ